MYPGTTSYIHKSLPACPNCHSMEGDCELGRFNPDSIEFECSCDNCPAEFKFFVYYTGHVIVDQISLLPALDDCKSLNELTELYEKWSSVALSEDLQNLSADEVTAEIEKMSANIDIYDSSKYVKYNREYHWLNDFIKKWEYIQDNFLPEIPNILKSETTNE